MLTKNCNYCGKEFTAYQRDRMYCNKECAGMIRRKDSYIVNKDLHEKYDKAYGLAQKKAKLLKLQRQNYIDELLLEQLPSTPDLKTRIQIVDTNGMILE